MTLHDFADLSIIVQGVFLPLSILVLIWQVRKQSKLTRAANAQSLVEIASPFNLALVQDPAIAELWRHGASRYADMDPVQQEQYINLINWWLMLHENIHTQRQEGLIDKAVYRSWQRDLEYFIVKQKLADRWSMARDFYHADFSRHVDEIIQRQRREREAG